MSDFVAIDFETADPGADSACAVGVVRVRDGRIAERIARLIRPPRQRFAFTWVHGITWEMVRNAPLFAEVWRELQPLLAGAACLVAHNAAFDRTCCGPAAQRPTCRCRSSALPAP